MRLASLALVGAGCLSTPSPSSGDDVTPIDASVPDAGLPDPCDRDVRSASACVAEVDLANGEFPGRPFAFREALVDDVNADGVDDLVVVSNAPPPDAGVFVLLGPIASADPGYHAFIPTDLEVGAIQVRALPDVGSACADLTLFGRTFDGTTGVVQVWPSVTGEDRLFSATPISAATSFTPDVTSLPVHVAWARLRDGLDDLVIGDLDTVRVVRVGGDVAELDAAPIVEVLHVASPPMFGWNGINGVEAYPVGDCARDQLLVVESDHGHVLVDGDSATPAGGAMIPIAAVSLGAASVDLDDAPPRDVVVTGGVELGAYLLDDASVTAAAGASMYDPYQDSYRLDGFAVGELGGAGSSPELVAIDNPDGAATGASRAILFDGLTATAAIVTSDAPRVYESFAGGFVAAGVVIGDLDDSGADDVWVISTDGELACLRRGTTIPQLEACP